MSLASSMPDAGNLLREQVMRLRGKAVALAALSFAITAVRIGAAATVFALIDSGLPSRSPASVGGLMAIAATLTAFGLVLGTLRRQSLLHLADVVDLRIDALVPAMLPPQADIALRDGLTISAQRNALTRMLSSRAVPAVLDLAALPLYFVVLFALGWPFGLLLLVTAAASAFVLAIGWRGASAAHHETAARRERYDRLAATATREAQPLAGQGIAGRIADLLRDSQLRTAQVARTAMARRNAVATRIAALALAGGMALVFVGAMQIIDTHATIGALIFASALFTMALWPFLTLAASTDVMAAGRGAWSEIRARLAAWTPTALTLPLPAPKDRLSLEQVALFLPGTRRPLLQQISAEVAAGEILAIVGPSGVGKSVLLRTLAARETTPAGSIRLDGCEIQQWPVGDLNRHIGYLPQEIDLFEGTVAENIARFDPLAAPQTVLAAAQAAGVHDRIVRLEQGYDTSVGPGGRHLPLALRQRIGLARALFGDPLILLLDDPASHLDAREAAGLISAIQAASARGAIVLIATGSPRLIDIADHVMMLRHGGMADFGPREDVRERVTARRTLAAAASAAPAPAALAPSDA